MITRSYLCLLWLFLGTIASIAQTQGKERGVVQANAQMEEEPVGRNLYFIIGIDQYESWFHLDNAVEDARGMEKTLQKSFGFEAALPSLLDREATRENILKAFDKLHKTLKHNDNLVLFFAGHGHTRSDTVGTSILQTGFLIPWDGRREEDKEWVTFLNLSHFLNRTSILPPRNIMVILDACHAGIALGSSAGRQGGAEARGGITSQKVSRRVISSARQDQLAQDSGPVPGHSLFTGMLLEGLETGRCDINKDMKVTSSELGLYLEDAVNDFSGGMQTPDFGAFSLDQRGEMELVLNENAPEMLVRKADAHLLRGELDEFLATAGELEERNIPLSSYSYIRFRAALLQHDADKAIETFESLITEPGSGIDTRSIYEMVRLLPQLRFWRNGLSLLPPAEPLIEISLTQEGSVYPVNTTSSKAFHISLDFRNPYFVEITNTSAKTLYVYLLYIDEYNVEVIRFEEGVQTGIAPGKTIKSPNYQNTLDLGYIELHLILSPEPLPVFENPPDFLASQSLPAWEPPAGLGSNILFLDFK